MDHRKEYNEAFKRAKELHETGNALTKQQMEIVFPQLAESEDERVRRTLVEYFGPAAQLDFIRGVPIQKIRDWLEKQRDHFRDDAKMVESEKPKEWSERENKMLASAISLIRDSECFDHFHDITKDDIISWLKSLRPSWKPSEEQMVTLAMFANLRCASRQEAATLESLYEQLKKL